MTGFARAKEDRPTPPEVVCLYFYDSIFTTANESQYNWRVYAVALTVAMGVMAYG